MLDLTTVALPNLIANELVIVKPMASMTGFIQYIQFVAGSNKGGVEQAQYDALGNLVNPEKSLFADPFRLGKMSDSRVNYTGSAVVENISATATEFAPAWTPVVGGKVILITSAGVETEATLVDGKVTFVAGTYEKVKYVYDNVLIPQDDLPILNAHVSGIALAAKARRIAIYYSQLAAFQAKTEMGADLGEMLATQACAELSYKFIVA